MDLTDETHQAIVDAIYAGRKIEAVKVYREATGEGLKESKDFVEALTARLREEAPDKVPAPRSGCGPLAVLVVAFGGAGGWWLWAWPSP